MRPSVFGMEVHLVYFGAVLSLSLFGSDYQHQLFS
jgi:hypothetical protein